MRFKKEVIGEGMKEGIKGEKRKRAKKNILFTLIGIFLINLTMISFQRIRGSNLKEKRRMLACPKSSLVSIVLVISLDVFEDSRQ